MPVDLTRFVHAGDTVLWGQGCAEPTVLTRRLMRQRHEIGRLTCFTGLALTGSVAAEFTDVVTYVTYCGGGRYSAMTEGETFHALVTRYVELPAVLSAGPLRADVALVLLSPADPAGWHGLAMADEYLSEALLAARVVVGQVCDRLPPGSGGGRVHASMLAAVVHSDDLVTAPPPHAPTEAERAIVRRVHELVEDGSTIQIGLGTLPDLILAGLSDHVDLGVHSGLITDTVAALTESGAVTNARKTRDRGVTVAGLVHGSTRLADLAHRAGVSLRPTSYTHDRDVLAGIDRFVAVNSALEVDLTGAVNSESAGGRYVGAVGGAGDFLAGARRSRGGLPIIALPSTHRERSRIVPELRGPTSTTRSEVGLVVTEWGVADLRGLTLAQRREAMLGIAHPDHRAELDRAGRVTTSKEILR